MTLAQIFDFTINYLVLFVEKIGYGGIVLGMFLESTPFPLPSEAVMIPAGIAASHGVMNIYLVIFFGVLGNFLGAIFCYYLAYSMGRTVLFRFGKYFFLKAEAIIKMESFFNRHGKISVFIGRLIPGVRHFISLAAGVVRMDFRFFCIYTLLGSTIWTAILAVLGFVIGANQELIKEYLHLLVIGVVIFCVILAIIYAFFKQHSLKKDLHILEPDAQIGITRDHSK